MTTSILESIFILQIALFALIALHLIQRPQALKRLGCWFLNCADGIAWLRKQFALLMRDYRREFSSNLERLHVLHAVDAERSAECQQ